MRYQTHEREKNIVSIYSDGNKYGYKLNINHSEIRKLYERFKAWKGIRLSVPLTDAQRFEFEEYVLKLLNKGKSNGDADAID